MQVPGRQGVRRIPILPVVRRLRLQPRLPARHADVRVAVLDARLQPQVGVRSRALRRVWALSALRVRAPAARLDLLPRLSALPSLLYERPLPRRRLHGCVGVWIVLFDVLV